MHESILTHARSRYLWIALALCVLSIGFYVWHDPDPVPNGGTWLGYTLGTIGALLIVWLLLFGVRKRSSRRRNKAACGRARRSGCASNARRA